MSNTRVVEYIVTPERAGWRLDRYVKERRPGASRRDILAWIEGAQVRCNGKSAHKGTILQAGDRITVRPAVLETGGGVAPEPEMMIRVLFEDSHILAVDKPWGVPTSPIRDGEKGTLANGMVARYPEMQGIGFSDREPGLLQRLDAGTSGVVLAARSPSAFERIRVQFEQALVTKVYKAIVHGRPEPKGEINLPIGSRSRRSSRVTVVRGTRSDAGQRGVRPAETRFRVMFSSGSYSLVRLEMRTGARHQLRAHMSFLGHPVVGDQVYGGEQEGPIPVIDPSRHLLHAEEIRFFHPESGKRVRIRSPLPKDFEEFLRVELRQSR